MKAIQQITITASNGQPIRDTADDVISLEHMKLKQEKKPLPMEAYPILSTEYLIKRMIDLSTYRTRSEQRRADEIYQKIKVTGDVNNPVILLEDGELDFLNKLLEKFTPYLNGRIFQPFHVAMETAKTVPTA
jgi:hypothetical protein